MKNNIKILNELQIELQNTFGINEEFRQQKLIEILLRYVSKLNDNPVPSLYEQLANILGAESVEYEQVCEIINGRETDKAQPENCIVGEEVVNLLNGKKYLFTEDLAQSLHLPTRLIKKG